MGRWLALLFLTTLAVASDFIATSGAWNVASNWNPAAVPTALDDVVIGAGKTVTITDTAQGITARSLLIHGTLDANPSTSGELLIEVGGDITVHGTLRVGGASGGADGHLLLTSQAPVLSGSGTILLGPGANGALITLQPGAAVTVGGSLTLQGSAWAFEQSSPSDGGGSAASAVITLGSGATIAVPAGACQMLYGTRLVVQGTLTLGSAAQLRYDGSIWSRLTVAASGTIDWTVNGSGLAGILLPGAVQLGGNLILRRPLSYRPAFDDVVTLIDLCTLGVNGAFATGVGTGDWALTNGFNSYTYSCLLERQYVLWGTTPHAVAPGGAEVVLPAHTSAGVPITYSLLRQNGGAASATISGTPGLVPSLVPEDLVVTATAPRTPSGSIIYDALYETYLISVGANQAQTVTIDTLTGPFYYGQQLTLSGTATSGAAILWSTPDHPLLDIQGNTATVVGVGVTATIQGDVASTGPYLPGSGSQVIGPFLPRPFSVVVDGGTRAFGETTPAPTFTFDGLAPGDDLSALGTPVFSGTGTTTTASTLPGPYPVSVAFPAQPNYAITVTPGSLVITKLPQTLTFTQPGSVIVGASTTLNASSSQGLPVTFISGDPSIATVSGTTLRGVAAGSVTITASQAGSATVAAATTDRTVTILPPPVPTTLTLTPLPGPYVYGDDITLSGTASSGATITWSTTSPRLSVSGNTATVVGIGSGVTVTASVPATGNWLAASSSITLGALVPRPVSVNVDGGTRTYGSANPTPTWSATGLRPGDPVSLLGTATFSGTGTSATTTTTVGSYPVTVGFSGGSANYSVSVAPGNLVITRRPQVITFPPLADLGRDLTATLSATSDAGLPVTFISADPATATVSGTTVHGIAPGIVTITASQAGTTNIEPASVAQPLVVFGSRLSQTVTITPLTGPVRYGDVIALTGASSSGAPLVWSSSSTLLQLSGASATVIGVGSGATIQADAPETTGYWAAVATASLPTIGKRPVTVTIAGGARFVGEANPTPTFTVTNLAPGDAATVLGTPTWTGTGATATATTAAGTYPVNATFPSHALYDITVVPGNLVISQRTQSITLAGPTSLFIGRTGIVTATSSAGLAVTVTSGSPAVASLSGGTLTALTPGQAVLTATQTGTTLYAPATATWTVTVTPLLTTSITLGDLSGPYRYGDEIPLTGSATSGAPLAWTMTTSTVATLTGSNLRITGTGVGPTLTATAAPTGDYAGASASVTLAPLLPRSVTVNVIGGLRAVGDATPAPSFSVTGLASGDTVGVLGTPTYAGPGTQTNGFTPVGRYPITVTFTGTDPRYALTLREGALVISTVNADGVDPGSLRGSSGCGVGTGLALCSGIALLTRPRRRTPLLRRKESP